MKIEKMSFDKVKNALTKDEMKKIMAGSEGGGGGGCQVNCFSSPYPSGLLGSVSVSSCPSGNTLVTCWNAGYSANYTSCTGC